MELDYKKILGICLKFINSEVSKSNASIEAIRGDIGALDSKIHEIDAKALELPDGLVYESHLDHSVALLTSKIDSSISSVQSNLDALKNTSDILYSQLVSKIELDFEEAAKSDTELEKRLSSDLDTLRSEYNSFKESALSSISSAESFLETLSKQLSTLDSRLTKAISDSEVKINSRIDGVDSKIEELKGELESDIDALEKSSAKHLDMFISFLGELGELTKKQESELADTVSSIHNSISDIKSSKADIEHEHEQYASKDELADAIEILVASITDGDSDSLKKSDRDALVSDISKLVQKTIKVPNAKDGKDGKDGIDGKDGTDGEDGKDALEWDIKWHQSVKGRLGIKRSDWKDYKWQDLLVKVQTQTGMQLGGFIGGGGGGGSSSSAVSSVNGKTGNVVLTLEDLGGSSTPEAGIIARDGNGDIDTIVVGSKTTTILRSGSTITGVNKGTYTKNFIRDGSGNITGWTIS